MWTNDSPAAGLTSKKTLFGTMPDGSNVDKYTLGNANQMAVSILSYGGIVQSIVVPDKHGKLGDVTLGFDKLEDYIQRSPYFGAIIGRFGNRIAKGRFTLNGKLYQIPINDGPNALHGGPEGFDKKLWKATDVTGPSWVGVELVYLSPDGEMGFPGNLRLTVRYTLHDDNRLQIDYSAMTDRETVVNLTNHAYFNLAGAGSGTVLEQVAEINADRFTPVNSSLIPTGELREVRGTPLNFTAPTAIGANIQANDPQLKYAEPEQGGYDFNWLLNHPGDLDALAVRVRDPESGRTIEMYTTEPGVQFYSSNFLTGTLKGKQGLTYAHWGGFTLEAQHYPDSPNQPHFPSTQLSSGETYSQTTVYKFLAID
ncbi:MAG: galactose mutarotase [Verrucomicrobia bacterium]|nr:galactose mutarotase [Verrucomicrobiota bacterium]